MKCLECGTVMKKKIVDHKYVECGLKNIILKNVEQFVCPKCREEELVIPNLEQLHKLIFGSVEKKKAIKRIFESVADHWKEAA